MSEKAGNSKKGIVIVAVIGAIATIGAAVISSINKPKDQAPTVQQTASGDGAINVGHDAFINNTAKSAGEEAAERVQACEEHHGMKTAFERVEGPQKVTPSDSPEDSPTFEFHTAYRYCKWPSTQYSDEDGYLEIKVVDVNGPGKSDASGTDDADRITAPCPKVVATYQYGHMGDYHNLDPITISANSVVTNDGQPWTKREDENDLPFYPATGEIVVLTSGHYGLENVKCAN